MRFNVVSRIAPVLVVLASTMLTPHQLLGTEDSDAPPRVRREIITYVDAQFPAAMAQGPARGQVVRKTRFDNGSELSVGTDSTTPIRTAFGKPLLRFFPDENQLGISSSPGLPIIAYYSHGAQDAAYYLTFWNISVNTVARAPVPPSIDANEPLRWSPDGTQLLYAPKRRDNKTDLFLLSIGNTTTSKELGLLAGAQFYSWNNSGSAFAAALEQDAHQLTVFDSEGRRGDTTPLPTSLPDLEAITWERTDHSFYISARNRASEWFQVYSLSRSGHVSPCLRTDGDLFNPIVRRDGALLVERDFHGSSLIVEARCGDRNIRTIGPTSGTVYIRGLDRDGMTLNAYYLSSTEPGALITIPAVHGQPSFNYTYQVPSHALLRTSPPARVFIKGAHGARLMVTTRSATTEADRPLAVVVTVHGGPHLALGTDWSLLAKAVTSSGAAYVTVNYHGSTGAGRSFVSSSNEADQVEDVVAACRYAIATLHPQNDRVILEGMSYGAYLALRVAAQEPELVKGLVLTSLLPVRPIPHIRQTPPHMIVRQYQGARDHLASPLQAEAFTKAVLGDTTFVRPLSHFYQLPHEGHLNWSNTAQAAVYSGLSELVRAGDRH